MAELETCCDENAKKRRKTTFIKNAYAPAIFSGMLLLLGVSLQHFIGASPEVTFLVYAISYLVVGWPVLRKAMNKLLHGDIFNEFFLMSVATIGAFYLKEYPEGVAVMLFYSIGELFQDHAVNRAKKSIESLINVQANEVTISENGIERIASPKVVNVGAILSVKPGGKVGLDGVLVSEGAEFNASALTGESIPVFINQGEEVLAGMISLGKEIKIEVTKLYADSRLSNILYLTQEATKRKAKTQNFISKFAKVYTPIVVGLAVLIVCIPYLFDENYLFDDYLYRGLVFLVVSCPCALVISIPLGYFGGIGAASKQGILLKGATFLDILTQTNTVVFDKTGTLTTGSFSVLEAQVLMGEHEAFVQLASSLENRSTHPIARSVAGQWTGERLDIKNVEEFPGNGIKGTFQDQKVIVGSKTFLNREGINTTLFPSAGIVVGVGLGAKLLGYFRLSDTLKENTRNLAKGLKKQAIDMEIYSGDRQDIVDEVGNLLQVDRAWGGLLPDEKLQLIEEKRREGNIVAFIGDGINDAPVIAAANVGIAMGALGSDAAIETADVVIQTDQPEKVLTAINIAHATRKIVWQNITLAIGVKVAVMVLGAGGIATLWEAVFADVGVALLAILNASRIQYFSK